MTVSTRASGILAVGFSALLLGGCATSTDVQPSNEEIARAEASIQQAQQSGAGEHSARELDLARNKLNQAQTAIRDEEFVLAWRLAREASADAELAAALARASQAETAADEIQETIATLRSEASRQ